MDLAQILVTAGGVGLIGLTLWFFFGKGAQPGSRGRAGRYACPMHPWVTSSDPSAQCSVCGMKLVSEGQPR
jgi:hypothetical protein